MKLERIELQNTGPFTAPVCVGPLGDGLNIMSARNEAGKTTVLIAAARALFDRHNVSGEAIERLQPVGTSLAPDLTVTFLTTEGRFRIHKQFINTPTSELSEDRDGAWHPIADGDAADARVLELIGGVRSGRGASKAEHWGLLRYLWARQDERADWPAWDDGAGAGIRTRLARVEIDPLLDRLLGQFEDAQAKQFTSTGRVSKNSTLQTAQQTLSRLEADLQQVRTEMEKVDQDLQALQHLREERVVRARESAETRKQVAQLTETLKQVELAQKDLERFNAAFESAEKRLQEIDKESGTLRRVRNDLKRTHEALAQRQAEVDQIHRDEKKVRETRTASQDDARTLRTKLDAGRRSEGRQSALLELDDLQENLTTLKKRVALTRKSQEALEELRRKRGALPDITRKQLAGLEGSERILRELDVRAEAVGLQIDINVQKDVTIPFNRDGSEDESTVRKDEVTSISATRHVRLQLPGWGEINITSGAQEAAKLENQITQNRLALDRDLKKIGVDSLQHAQTCADQIRDLENAIKSVRTVLTERLEGWDAMADLVAEADRTAAATHQIRDRLKVGKSEDALSRAELKAEIARIHTAVESDESAWTSLQKSIEEQTTRLEALGSSREKALSGLGDARTGLAALESQAETLQARYPDGIEQEETRAQEAFVTAKAELKVAMRKLPDGWEKLEARHERALKSAEQAARSHHELETKIQNLETLLNHAGSQGLFTRETDLTEAVSRTDHEAARQLNHALAARFLTGLIDFRKKAAVRTVLKPLEDQLSATFAEITADHHRHVFLDEKLQVAGIGRKRDATIAFAQLSQGAREQLLLALRVSVALELAKNGPQILILDDVLVNTDATRQENVLDCIQRVAREVQVLIVTCHPERYRGMGRPLEILPAAD